MPRVSAAVLNYDGRDLLEVILPSLAAQEYRDFETIVVDNGSTDDSVSYVRETWPQVRVVSAGVANVGVAAALNIAVRTATGEFVALLNNDIELDSRWLGELVAALDRHPEAATAAGKLLSYHRRERIDGAGDIFTRAAVAWGRGSGQLDRGQYDHPEEVFAPTAGAGLYRTSALADVGSFDESFIAYFEDVDWGLRAQLAGYRSRYVPTAVGYHMGSMTTRGDENPLYYELQRRNTLAVSDQGRSGAVYAGQPAPDRVAASAEPRLQRPRGNVACSPARHRRRRARHSRMVARAPQDHAGSAHRAERVRPLCKRAAPLRWARSARG